MSIGGRCTIVVCLSFGLAFTAQAQDRPNGFYLTTPLIVSGGYEQGLFTGTGQLDDAASIVTMPTIEWIRSTHRLKFYVNYLPEFELFAGNPKLDAFNNVAATRLEYRV